MGVDTLPKVNVGLAGTALNPLGASVQEHAWHYYNTYGRNGAACRLGRQPWSYNLVKADKGVSPGSETLNPFELLPRLVLMDELSPMQKKSMVFPVFLQERSITLFPLFKN